MIFCNIRRRRQRDAQESGLRRRKAMRSTFWRTLVAAALLAAMQGVLAQAFPGKIVRFVIPFPVGGSSDANARIIGPYLSERWKQQVIVDPRPGAATVVGSDHVAKSAPDG